MKIGLLLGTFDPIHIGHISMASCVLNSNVCEKVLFVVAKHNPWKEREPASFELRCKMVEAAIRSFNGKCEVCTIENNIEPPTYSYKVLEEIKKSYLNDELFLILGTDTFKSLPQWKNYESHIKDKIEIIEISRGDGLCHDDADKPFVKVCSYDEKVNEYKSHYKLIVPRMDISSTMVRNVIENGMIPMPYLNEEVFNIITVNNLYRNGK